MEQIRVKHVMTDEELSEVHRLNKKILAAHTEEEIKSYRNESDSIIENAKKRYYQKNNLENLKN